MAGSVNVQDTTTSQRIPMDKIIKNTKFPWASEHMKNDIIIIKLKSPLKFNDKVQPACLPDAASFVKAQASKQMAVLSGWGGPMKNDIIIIKLKSPLKFNDKVQ